MPTTSISGLPETLTINGATVAPVDFSGSTYKVSVTTLGAFITQNATTVSATGTVTGATVNATTVNATTVSATGTVTGGNLSATGTVTTSNLSVTGTNNIIPAGVITMWSGSIATIPTGWLLCNGSNGTPDLRDRFIVGAGSTYAVAATGGSADAIVVSHSHSATSTITDPGHYHNMGNGSEGSLNALYGNDGNQGSGWRAANSGGAGVNGRTDTKTTGITAATSVASSGSSGTNANLPPYLGIQFIIKT
jgi:hypothetical protein